jgi:hypothetical protein
MAGDIFSGGDDHCANLLSEEAARFDVRTPNLTDGSVAGNRRRSGGLGRYVLIVAAWTIYAASSWSSAMLYEIADPT